MAFRIFLQILAFCVLISPAAAQERPQPEIATGMYDHEVATGEDFMIVTANPHATRAGYNILKKGGSAVDAAIAAQLVLGLVEPQSSGLGGGAFVLHYDAKSKKLRSYDGRETAPNLAGPHLFQQQGKTLHYWDAVLGGRSVGVPGLPVLLSDIHERHGKLTWMELFDDAITLAGQGFKVSPRLAKQIAANAGRFDRERNAASWAYFTPNDTSMTTEGTLVNFPYQTTLKDMAFSGADIFYHGKIARNIIKTVQGIAENPGLLTAYDFENYTVKERDPVCGPYRAYIVCSMGEPSSGGISLLQTLGMLEHFEITRNNAQSWHLITQASALAFADRSRYIADPDFVKTPGTALLNPDYLKSRAALMSADKAIEHVEAGTPPNWNAPPQGQGAEQARPGTSHISIIDSNGNIVSMTTTIEGAFGSHLMVDGFLLNNELSDFSFSPNDKDGNPVANRVEGGKRPRSNMSPTIIFDKEGNPVLIIGSAGGSRIIGYVLQRIISVLDWGMEIDEALTAPHILARDKCIEMEEDEHQEALQSKGNTVTVKGLNSGLTAIRVKDQTYKGFADPRREGIAMGE